jgi:hypothetical protein
MRGEKSDSAGVFGCGRKVNPVDEAGVYGGGQALIVLPPALPAARTA